jgi:hypothetical protein
MKLKPLHIAVPLLLGGLMLLATAAIAQENRNYNEPEVIFKETKTDPPPVAESESRSVIHKPVLRDSVQVKPVKPSAKPAEKGSKDKSEDPLSFNFLYYIIEKFKMSDMIE